MSRFNERSYGGRLLRPTPEFHIEDDLSFGIIATPWGPRSSANKVIEILRDFVQSAREDNEVTSPFQKLTNLSPLANSLRAGIMLANDSIYRDENKAEYVSGVEVFAFAHAHGEFAFAQVGFPNLFLLRAGLPWVPLSVQVDLATELSAADKILPPLPQNLIGLHTTTNLNVSSLRTTPGDQFILLSHPFFSLTSHLTYDQSDLDTISRSLANSYPDQPFWLGIIKT